MDIKLIMQGWGPDFCDNMLFPLGNYSYRLHGPPQPHGHAGQHTVLQQHHQTPEGHQP